MKPLVELPRAAVTRLTGVFTDFDGTITTDGKLTSEAYSALWRLAQTRLHVVIVTGRSAGWADLMVRNFPVNAVVAEQGGVTLVPRRRGVEYVYAQPRATLERDRRSVLAAARAVQRLVPRARIATDAAYARVNMAFDHAEEVSLSETEVDAIERALHRRGLSAVRSSVHVNFWKGRFSKLSACRRLARRQFHGQTLERWAFIGDSANDAPMFAGVPLSVGVANVKDSLERIPVAPAYVTRHREGQGFVEFVEYVLRRR
jgi:HAD superfamily hydrolase (TIGR01484 family)